MHSRDVESEKAIAFARWERARPIAPDTVAWHYLERARGLAIRGIARELAEGHLRWSPEERHPCGYSGPALVALVTDAVTSEPMTVHRTWLAPDGSGKAAIEHPRLLWPGLPKAGGCVRLFPDEEVTIALGLAEGIETALELAIAAHVPSWVAIDAGNLANFPILEGIETLWLMGYNDEAGVEAARAASERWQAEGREVVMFVTTPDRDGFADESMFTMGS